MGGDRRELDAGGHAMRQIVSGREWLLGPWICEKLGISWVPGIGRTIGLLRGNDILCALLYENFNGASVHMHVAAEKGRLWTVPDFLWYIFHYPFVEMGVNKVIALVATTNPPSEKLCRHLGFVEECRVKDACPGGDVLVLTMTREQCRFLEKPNG